jgi:methyl-accepting chemotaxis protein
MRVIEKDFILYGDASVMGAHRKAYREFEFGMMGSGLDSATQETLARLAAEYRAELSDYVENQVKLNEQISTFNGVLAALPERFANLFAAANAGMDRARSEKTEVRHATGRAGVTMGAVILVVALMTSLILVRSITRPLRAIEQAMQRLATGTATARCRARTGATRSAPWRVLSRFSGGMPRKWRVSRRRRRSRSVTIRKPSRLASPAWPMRSSRRSSPLSWP